MAFESSYGARTWRAVAGARHGAVASNQAIVRLPDGMLAAGSDPRRDGYALAW